MLKSNGLRSVTSPVKNEGDINERRALIPMREVLQQQMAKQAKFLTGDLDGLSFVYYEKLMFPDPINRRRWVAFPNVLLVDTQASQFEESLDQNAKMEKGTIKKWTAKLTRQKHFEYTGNVTQQEMFAALQVTRWNMANLKKATDLVKKG